MRDYRPTPLILLFLNFAVPALPISHPYFETGLDVAHFEDLVFENHHRFVYRHCDL